ncbi:hypothetical protein HAX54_002190, partial [Datura stramonium]|nr:hypothetical protein [Datura stramonium]
MQVWVQAFSTLPKTAFHLCVTGQDRRNAGVASEERNFTQFSTKNRQISSNSRVSTFILFFYYR